MTSPKPHILLKPLLFTTGIGTGAGALHGANQPVGTRSLGESVAYARSKCWYEPSPAERFANSFKWAGVGFCAGALLPISLPALAATASVIYDKKRLQNTKQ